MSWRSVRAVAITDRRLMVAPGVLASGDLGAIAAAFGAAIARALLGVPAAAVCVQVREKDLDGGALLALARAAATAAHAAGVPVVVNDRADVALAAGADGVHIPERGLPIEVARALVGPAMSVGASRHDRAGVLAAVEAGAEVIQLGPIWPTPSKAGLIDALGEAALAVRTGAHLVAVGGIDSAARARAARAAGADAVAAIRAVWLAPDPAAALAAFAESWT